MHYLFRRCSAGRTALRTIRLAARGVVLTLSAAPTAAAEPPRLALVVGNGEYAALPQLPVLSALGEPGG